jgi:heme oxygenase
MNIMQDLKERTREYHNNAEGQEFQRSLASGELSRELYVEYLSQLWIIHGHLERRLEESQSTCPQIKEVLTESQLQVPFLERDLQFFGANTELIRPAKSTRDLLHKIDLSWKGNPISLLGYHYVLLGSKHGGKFIAHNLQEKYKLNQGVGAIYFDPYGANFQQIWKSFSLSFNEVPLTDAERDAVIQAAADTFVGVSKLSEELLEESKVS